MQALAKQIEERESRVVESDRSLDAVHGQSR
jgi:hypothetical protein